MELQVCQILLHRHLAPLLLHSVHAASTPWERGAPTATCFHVAESQVKVTLPEAQDERHWVQFPGMEGTGRCGRCLARGVGSPLLGPQTAVLPESAWHTSVLLKKTNNKI